MEGRNNHVPGWRIEQKFNNKVLIGNWSEERRKFQRGRGEFGNTTHRCDFRKYDNCLPDMKIRREASMRDDGLQKDLLFTHHGFGYSNNLISLYDQLMNKRSLKEMALPKLRTWDGKTLAWHPEKSDHPLLGQPTVFGLHEKLIEKWKKEKLGEDAGFQSTYRSSFEPHPKQAMCFQRYATTKPLSSHFHSHTINKNLSLRDNNVNLAPEFLPPPKVAF